MKETNITTSHTLAKELISKPDGFITVTLGEHEYIIESIRKTKTNANIDDSIVYWTLRLNDYETGNIIR